MKTIQRLLLLLLSTFPSVGLGQNIIPNGGFENDFASWVPVDNVSISTSVVRSGSKSLMASDTTATQFSYAYQQLSLDYGTNEITFWVNPASSSYFSAFELIANWQSGTAIFITRVLLRDNALSLTAVDTSTTIPNILAQNTWNKITIFVRKSSLTQDFFINDSLVSSLTSSSFPTIEHLLVGDLSGSGMFGTVYFDDISITDSTTTAISDKRETVPGVFVLRQNFPNPFNPTTQISYSLSRAADVELTIINLQGQRVKALVHEFQTAGLQSATWDGVNDHGVAVTSGVYLFQLTAGSLRETKKMILLWIA